MNSHVSLDTVLSMAFVGAIITGEHWTLAALIRDVPLKVHFSFVAFSTFTGIPDTAVAGSYQRTFDY